MASSRKFELAEIEFMTYSYMSYPPVVLKIYMFRKIQKDWDSLGRTDHDKHLKYNLEDVKFAFLWVWIVSKTEAIKSQQKRSML